jgi:hypothetical protein
VRELRVKERGDQEATVSQNARIKNQKVEKQREDEMWKMNDFINLRPMYVYKNEYRGNRN